ncbi:hypothetical protein SESBI_42091 [Sesbania bispinosa]|nr:hypothetical protein SESBI_42091 [Sesbania bispinosa]
MMKRESSSSGADAGNGKKRHYKLWFLAAIIMVALWSMFTGSVILKWSEGNHSLIREDLDVLEVEEREKVVRHMWDVYTHRHNPLPQFWSEAFQAAYHHLVSDVPAARDAAVSEIAKMSLLSLNLQSA